MTTELDRLLLAAKGGSEQAWDQVARLFDQNGNAALARDLVEIAERYEAAWTRRLKGIRIIVDALEIDND